MKLYKEYLSALEELRKGSNITKAYFTSFNLSPEFFETYILPPLLEEDVPDNSFQYESLNVKLEALEKKLDIKVLYDANMMQLNEQKRTILKFIPILMTNKQGKRKGLFHPKVIYIENNKGKGKLFVGSGNLTLSGWGRNIEAFQIVDVEKDSNFYNQIYNFFIDVQIQANIFEKGKKRYKQTHLDKKYNFIYSFEKDSENSIFLKSIDSNTSSQLYVWSPYFSDELDPIIKDNFKAIKKVHIIPDLVGIDKKIRLKKKPKLEQVEFYSLEDNDSENMNHSKVWISDNKIGIGSYNFTKEALFGVNFEAAIVRDIKNIDLSLKKIDFNQMSEEEFNDEKLVLNTNFDLLFDLVADWKDRTFKINQIVGDEIEGFKVLLPSGKEYLKEELDSLSMLESEKIFRSLIRNKLFKVKHKSKIVYEGIIFEESTEGFREPAKVETINDLFISFLDKNHPYSSRKVQTKTLNFDENNNDMQDNQTDTSYLNYFNLFKGFENFLNKLPDNERDLKHYCFTSGNSISSIMVVIEEYKEDSNHYNLFTYLFIKEFNLLANKINKIINKNKISMDNIENIDNIKLRLTKADEKFLEAFYG